MYKKYLLFFVIVFGIRTPAYSQTEVFSKHSFSQHSLIFAGINKTPLASTDDGYCAGLNFPLPYRFRVGLIGRYRPVQPMKISWSAVLESDLYRHQRHQLQALTMLGKYYGGGHSQFDHRYWKWSIGAGYRLQLWKNLGASFQFFPWSSYLNTRKDNYRVHTPSSFASYEMFVNLFYAMPLYRKKKSEDAITIKNLDAYPYAPTSISVLTGYPGTIGGMLSYSFARLINPIASAETGDIKKIAVGNRWGLWKGGRHRIYLLTAYEMWISKKGFDFMGGRASGAFLSNVSLGSIHYLNKHFFLFLEGGTIIEGKGYYQQTGKTGLGLVLQR